MRAFVSPEKMAQLDKQTMSGLSVSSYELMNLVAAEMAEKLEQFLFPSSKLLVVCGPGNNGGDGYCLARILKESGYTVEVFPVYPPKSPDCKKAAKEFRTRKLQKLGSLNSYDFVIDAVFGLSGNAELDSQCVGLFKKLNQLQAFRVALDVPTGVSCQNTKVHSHAFQSDLTLCVAYPKEAFLELEIAGRLGRLEIIDPGFKGFSDSQNLMIESRDFSIPAVSSVAHKKGRCGLLGGSSHTPGAIFLAAEAAHRTGVGYVHLFFPELKTLKLDYKKAVFLYHSKIEPKELKQMDALVLGPGGLPKQLPSLDQLKIPIVLDAAALASWKPLAKSVSKKRILTPHPGEAARMLNIRVQEVVENPKAALRELVRKTGQSVYLKGPIGYLAFEEKSAKDKNYVNLSANQAFARAGSGDVLSGIMGGFLARSPNTFEESVFSALAFQNRVGELLREMSASIVSDQLELFSEAFKELKPV